MKRLHTTVAVTFQTQDLLRECVAHLNKIKSDQEPRYTMTDLAYIAVKSLHDKLVLKKP